MLHTSVLLPCSELNRTERVAWKVVIGHYPTDISQYLPPNKPSSSTEKLLMPLYERVRQLINGSLLIRDVVHTDELWYQCRVNEKTCYEVKLLLKGYKTFYSSTTLLSTVITDAPTPADNTVGQTEHNNSDESETVTTNLTEVMMTTIASLCVLISLTICVILYFLRKQRSKFNSQNELNCQTTVYYSNISGVGLNKQKLLHQTR
ncbi:uncharacterized protein [Garra rufa]|uniref:uncharacterized protein n=1 Tax=Garra rufa TaxID=137080 RepID=UPI003CCE5CF4